ncbi:MAG: hypothetical protein CL735_02540 [Chloroflexi bacterium]|nr:hypothetical protein [Chloroflexota bacterium]
MNRMNNTNQFYNSMGVKKVINGASWLTKLGGSIMPSPVIKTMEEASKWFVDMDDLNQKAGEFIAKITGAEAGLVTAGAASGMVLQAAACIAGSDPYKINQLPNTNGMKNEIIIDKGHLVAYHHSFRAAGAKMVEIGGVGNTEEWELEHNINCQTAAIAYIFSPVHHGAIPLEKVIKIAHSKEVPVIVDASAMLPPQENLQKFINMGADMVTFSGGKGIRGPQSTGILCGKKHLIEAAYLNGPPHANAVCRSAKVCKEEIAGLITALQLFIDTDFDQIISEWTEKCTFIVESVSKFPGVQAKVEKTNPQILSAETTHPRAIIDFDETWNGVKGEELINILSTGDPSIHVRPSEKNGITIHPVNLQTGEEKIIVEKLIELLK